MDSFVFAAVLFAAACHAGWNAVIKVGLDALAATVLIAVGAGVVALALLPVVGLPAAPALPYVATSVAIHLGYFVGLIESYRAGDLGQVYPIARGSAPLLTAAASAPVIGEAFGIRGWLGIGLLAAGVLLISLRGGRDVRLDRRAVGFALFTALTICAYSLVDGIGARLAHNAAGYSAVLFVGNAIVMAGYGCLRRGTGLIAALRLHAGSGLAGGALQFFSYAVAIWAMTVAPIAIVAALRETSVLFGAAIAVVLLKEPLRTSRLVAAILILCGLVLMRLQ
jgi:drug/metabolite transporter (DMT)-like permease